MNRFALSTLAAVTLFTLLSASAEAQPFRQNRSKIVTNNFSPKGSVQTVQKQGPLRQSQSVQAVSPFGTLNSNSVTGRRGITGASKTQVNTPFGTAKSQEIHGAKRSIQKSQTSTPLGTATTRSFNGPRHNVEKSTVKTPNGGKTTVINRR